MSKDNTTLNGTPNADQDQNSLDSGAIAAIVLSTLTVLIAFALVSLYIVHRKQRRRVTLTMRRTQRIKRMDVLHIDVEYSDTILDSPTSDRLSAGYTNLCSDISLEQNLENPHSSRAHNPSGKHDNIDLTDPDFCTNLNELKDSDVIISHSFPEAFDESNYKTTTKCFSEEQSNDDINLVPPVRFDFDASSTNGSEIEIEMALKALRNEEMTAEDLRCKDNSSVYLNDDGAKDLNSVQGNNDDKIVGTEVADNDRESLIERQNATSFDNQGLEVTD